MKIESIEALVLEAEKYNVKVSDIVIDMQAKSDNTDKKNIIEKMDSYYQIMKESVEKGIEEKFNFKTGLQNDIVNLAYKHFKSNKTLLGEKIGRLIVSAMAVSGYNACMGRIIAAPTAGSCGIMPAVLTYCEDNGYKREDIVKAIFTAAGFADIIAQKASFAGSEGGCMAECGSASGMAAASMVEIMGGTPREASHAFALSISTILGLICDPIAGYVEFPCMNKNVLGSIQSVTFAELALAGVKSIVPADEVVMAMKEVGDNMDTRFKETSLGGLANTKTGVEIAKKLGV